MNVTIQIEGRNIDHVDRLFGWTCAWIENFIQEKPIYGLQDLLSCYKSGAQDMVNTDPEGPTFHIVNFDPGERRPEPRTFLQCPNFLITRTYCLASSLQPQPHGIRIHNHVFSDARGAQLPSWTIESRKADELDEAGQVVSKPWRRGFWSGERSWEATGPSPGDINEVVRRHQAQKDVLPPPDLENPNEMEAILTRAASRLHKAAAKKRRQAKVLRMSQSNSSSNDNSSSSSSSSQED